jgi:hypothetical protein
VGNTSKIILTSFQSRGLPFSTLNVFVCRVSAPEQAIQEVHFTPFFSLSADKIIQQLSKRFSRAKHNPCPEFQPDSAILYVVGGLGISSDNGTLLDLLSTAVDLDNVESHLDQAGYRFQEVGFADELQQFIDLPDIHFVIFPFQSRSQSTALNRYQTPSVHGAAPGIQPTPLRHTGSLRGSIVTEGSSTGPTWTTGTTKAKGRSDAMLPILESSLTDSYEYLCSNAIESLLATVLGLEFFLRSKLPSRTLESDGIFDIIKAQYGRYSAEIDVFGYVDYYTEIRITEEEADKITSIGHTNLQVIFHLRQN